LAIYRRPALASITPCPSSLERTGKELYSRSANFSEELYRGDGRNNFVQRERERCDVLVVVVKKWNFFKAGDGSDLSRAPLLLLQHQFLPYIWGKFVESDVVIFYETK
jgi:hypothetical protein